MIDALPLAGIAALAYLGTNVDNFAILVALYGRFPGRAAAIMTSHAVLTGLLVALAALMSRLGDRLPVEYIGFLGVVPLALGCYWLYRLWRPPAAVGTAPTIARGTAFGATFLAQAGNVSDSLIVLAALLSDTAGASDTLVALAVLLSAVGFALVARIAVESSTIGAIAGRWAHIAAPFVMIGVGAYILLNTARDVLPGG